MERARQYQHHDHVQILERSSSWLQYLFFLSAVFTVYCFDLPCHFIGTDNIGTIQIKHRSNSHAAVCMALINMGMRHDGARCTFGDPWRDFPCQIQSTEEYNCQGDDYVSKDVSSENDWSSKIKGLIGRLIRFKPQMWLECYRSVKIEKSTVWSNRIKCSVSMSNS